MTKPIPTDRDERMRDIVRIGNRAARRAQLRNCERGIPNWYSINGRLVSDAQGIDIEPVASDTPSATPSKL